jgi:hypothetical protein
MYMFFMLLMNSLSVGSTDPQASAEISSPNEGRKGKRKHKFRVGFEFFLIHQKTWLNCS